MPRIPTYETQGRPTAEVGGVKTTMQVPVTSDFVNKAQTAIANYYVNQQQEEAKLKSLDYENKAYVGLFDIHDKWKNHPIPSEAADGFQKESKDYISTYIGDNLSNENNFVRKATESKLNAALSHLNLSVLDKSRDLFEKNQIKVDNEYATTFETKLMLDKNFRFIADEEATNFVTSRFNGPDKIANENKQNIEFQKLMRIKDDSIALIDSKTSPPKFLTDLAQDPTLYKNADPNKLRQYIAYAQTHVAMNADKMLKAEERAVLNGSSTGVDYNLIREGFAGSTEYSRVDDALKTLEVVKPVANQVINSKFGEGYKNIELLNLETNDPILKKKAMTYLKNMNDQKVNTIVKDGGAEYFINNDQLVNGAFDTFLIQQDQTSFKTYSSLLNKKYDEQQIPPAYRTYLSKNQITEIKKTFDGFENGQQKSNYIETIKQTYGESYPQIFNQLNKSVGIGFALSGSVNDPELKSALATSNIKPEQFKLYSEQAKLRSGDTQFEINLTSKIYDGLKPYRQILERQPYTDNKSVTETLGQITDSLAKSANVLSSDKNKSAADLASLVTSKFLSDYDFSNDNYFIPSDINGLKVNKKLIDAKANLFKEDIKYGRVDLNNYNIVPFEDNGVPKPKETISLIKQYGQFYLDGSNGLVFGVKLPNGKFKTVDTVDPITKQISPIKIGFLDYDGTIPIKNNNNKNYILDMEKMLSFMDVKDQYTIKGMPAMPF
jgi:hypothetical protein